MSQGQAALKEIPDTPAEFFRCRLQISSEEAERTIGLQHRFDFHFFRLLWNLGNDYQLRRVLLNELGIINPPKDFFQPCGGVVDSCALGAP